MVRILTKNFWVINLLFLAAAAWLLAHLFIVVLQDRLTPYPKPGLAKGVPAVLAEKLEPYERYALVTERNIFNPAEKGLKLLPLGEKKPMEDKAGEASETGKAPAGSYQLVGTVIGPGIHSYAIVQEGPDRKQRIYRLNDSLEGGRIVKIFRNRMVINRQGKEENLFIAAEKSSPKPAVIPSPRPPAGEVVRKLSANRFLVNREDAVASVGNINQFMTQAQLKPHFVMGRPGGFSVSGIRPGSLLEKLGLRNNDVIKKVNGQPINKPEEVFQAYSQFQRDSNIAVEIERNNRIEVFQYEIR